MSATLFRLIARMYLGVFALALVGVVLIYLVADFGDRLNVFLNHPVAHVAELYWYKALMTTHQLAPAAMLLAAGATVSVLRKRAEWTAIQALGGSRWTVVTPVLVTALAVAGCLIVFDELVVTRAGEKVDVLMVHRFGRWGDYGFFYFPKQWFRVGDHIVHVRGATEDSGRLRDVTLYRLRNGFQLDARIDADALESRGGEAWVLFGARVRRFEADGSSALSLSPEYAFTMPGSDARTFRIRQGRPEQMPLADLQAQQVIRARVGLPVERFSLAMHNRFAYPLLGVAAALLAMSLALRPARRGHLTLALIEGLLVSLALFTFMLMAKALVLGERISPAAAAWTPIVGLVVLGFGLWGWAEGQLRPSARR
ncbi:MAG: LptF/LptG family permease [Myxococcaceae bacterium]|nr:LptF/LptG family permease [Myxococcaceae bacterium]